MKRSIAQTVALAAVCLALAGCVSLFPKAKPVQMYRFGMIDAVAGAPAVRSTAVLKGAVGFPAAAAGDRMLTATGAETAYIAEARWVSPAQVMFDDAIERAFDARPDGPRLVTRGDQQDAAMVLRVDVDTFEARYLDGPDAAPTVVVSMRATLVRARDRAVMGERVLRASKPAASNNVSAIVAAFDAGVKETLGELTAWTAGTAG